MRHTMIALSLLLFTALPSQAQVSVGVNIGVNVPVYPRLVPVPGYPVYYDPLINANYFFYDGLYWVYQYDNWYASNWYNGPWELMLPEYVPLYILRVPVRYYRQPPVYFRRWDRDDSPQWGERWGQDWEHRRNDGRNDGYNRNERDERERQEAYRSEPRENRPPQHMPQRGDRDDRRPERPETRPQVYVDRQPQPQPQPQHERPQPPANRESRPNAHDAGGEQGRERSNAPSYRGPGNRDSNREK